MYGDQTIPYTLLDMSTLCWLMQSVSVYIAAVPEAGRDRETSLSLVHYE